MLKIDPLKRVHTQAFSCRTFVPHESAARKCRTKMPDVVICLFTLRHFRAARKCLSVIDRDVNPGNSESGIPRCSTKMPECEQLLWNRIEMYWIDSLSIFVRHNRTIVPHENDECEQLQWNPIENLISNYFSQVLSCGTFVRHFRAAISCGTKVPECEHALITPGSVLNLANALINSANTASVSRPLAKNLMHYKWG